MLRGDCQRFAIEAEVDETTTSGWVFGRIRFWLDGHQVGDWDDATDLKGCLNWLRDFFERPRPRFEPILVGLPAAEVFKRVHDGVMRGSRQAVRPDELVPDAFSRFHISHLGMSSFDRVALLLLKDELGHERVIWRGADDRIRQAFLEPREMERVAEEFCLAFETELA